MLLLLKTKIFIPESKEHLSLAQIRTQTSLQNIISLVASQNIHFPGIIDKKLTIFGYQSTIIRSILPHSENIGWPPSKRPT